jgi:hypothetical protein
MNDFYAPSLFWSLSEIGRELEVIFSRKNCSCTTALKQPFWLKAFFGSELKIAREINAALIQIK